MPPPASRNSLLLVAYHAVAVGRGRSVVSGRVQSAAVGAELNCGVGLSSCRLLLASVSRPAFGVFLVRDSFPEIALVCERKA